MKEWVGKIENIAPWPAYCTAVLASCLIYLLANCYNQKQFLTRNAQKAFGGRAPMTLQRSHSPRTDLLTDCIYSPQNTLCSKKTSTFLFVELTNFNHFWCAISRENFDMNILQICPPHLSDVATLPREIPKSFSTVIFIENKKRWNTFTLQIYSYQRRLVFILSRCITVNKLLYNTIVLTATGRIASLLLLPSE